MANAELASETFGLELGSLRAGCAADLVVWDYLPPTPFMYENRWGHVLFGLVDSRATDVLVAGRHVLAGGRATLCDEVEIRMQCVEAARRLWRRF